MFLPFMRSSGGFRGMSCNDFSPRNDVYRLINRNVDDMVSLGYPTIVCEMLSFLVLSLIHCVSIYRYCTGASRPRQWSLWVAFVKTIERRHCNDQNDQHDCKNSQNRLDAD